MNQNIHLSKNDVEESTKTIKNYKFSKNKILKSTKS